MSQSNSAVLDTTALMKSLMLDIVQALVDYPDDVRVDVMEDSDMSLIRVRVAPTDIGKVIGKQGRTARSLRTIVSAISMKYHRRFALDIVEEQE